MGDFNRVLSFILGLIVVVVFLIIVLSRFNVGEKISSMRKPSPKVTATVMPTKKPQPSRAVTPTGTNYQQPTAKPGTITHIPNTGAPTLLLPLAFAALVGGAFLKRS